MQLLPNTPVLRVISLGPRSNTRTTPEPSLSKLEASPEALAQKASTSLLTAIDQHKEKRYFDFQKKTLSIAKEVLQKKLNSVNKPGVFILDPESFEEYKNIEADDRAYKMVLDIRFPSLFKLMPGVKRPDAELLEELVMELNNDFYNNGKLGKFSLYTASKKNYGLFFKPSTDTKVQEDFLANPRNLAKKLLKELKPEQVLDSDEMMALFMEDCFLTTLGEKNKDFICTRIPGEKFMRVFFLSQQALRDFNEYRKEWNDLHNVEQRLGVMKAEYGYPNSKIYFYPSSGNIGLDEFKSTYLTPNEIARLEEDFDIYYDN